MPKELLAEWGNNLKRLRKERQLSLNEIAEKAGITKSYYCYLEAGQHEASTDIKIRLARDVFGVEVVEAFPYPPIEEAS